MFCINRYNNGACTNTRYGNDRALSAGWSPYFQSLHQPVQDFNSQNPSLPLNEFRAIDSSPDKANLTRAASKIQNLYASTAAGARYLKNESIQMTWLPFQGPEQKAAKAKAQEYMAAVIRTLTPLMTKTQSQKKLQSLLTAGKNKRYYTETEGALRYVVADNSKRG